MKRKEPTCTSVVLEYLVKLNDFATRQDIAKQTGFTDNQVSAALSHLNNRKAVDFAYSNHVIHWFATPETDNRTKQVRERTPEEPGTRNRTTGYHSFKKRREGV